MLYYHNQFKTHLTQQIIKFKDSQGNTIWWPTVWKNADEIVAAVLLIRQYEGRPKNLPYYFARSLKCIDLKREFRKSS